jgi:hypothetical protein
MAGDERDRLAPPAAFDECREPLVESVRSVPATLGQEAGAIPAERVPRQYFGVDGGLIRGQPGTDQHLPRFRDPVVQRSHDVDSIRARVRTGSG